MNYCKTIIPITTMMILITSCGSPSADSKTKKIIRDQEQLEKDIAMYQFTFDFFFKIFDHSFIGIF